MKPRRGIEKLQQRFFEGVGVPGDLPFVVDGFQREAIDAVTAGHDTLVVAPTGSGKTFIALEAIRSTLGQKGRAVYTTPLKALSNTKFNELKRTFEPEYSVGLLTGDRKIEVDADLLIATTEIYRNELYSGVGRYSVVVLDEVHFIADNQRGPVWEESIILTPPETTLLMLSASISNVGEVTEWIEHVRGKPCRLVMQTERAVELRLGFLHPDLGVLPLEDEKGSLLPEVRDFYGSMVLDGAGLRLKGGGRPDDRRRGGGGPPRSRRGGRGRGRSK